jgi:hypothetical protein
MGGGRLLGETGVVKEPMGQAHRLPHRRIYVHHGAGRWGPFSGNGPPDANPCAATAPPEVRACRRPDNVRGATAPRSQESEERSGRISVVVSPTPSLAPSLSTGSAAP